MILNQFRKYSKIYLKKTPLVLSHVLNKIRKFISYDLELNIPFLKFDKENFGNFAIIKSDSELETYYHNLNSTYQNNFTFVINKPRE